MDFGIKGKVALVLASSQGLGKASAISLAREGVRVAICSRDHEKIGAAASEINSILDNPSSAQPFVADVSDPDQLATLFQGVNEKLGEIDILVTNAGGPPAGSFNDLDDEKWKRGFDLNLLSVIRTIRAAIPPMVKKKWGRIINITSLTVKQPVDDLMVSSVLRPGILGFSKIVANRFAKDGITINNVAPGFIMTARQEELGKARAGKKGISFDDYVRNSSEEIPARRFGTPEELGNVIAFLASNGASYINGTTISVDGGVIKGLF